MSKFKVGDEVIIIDESYGWGRVTKGNKGTIYDISSNGTIYIITPKHQYLWSCKEKDIELINKKSKEAQMKDLKKPKFMVYGTGCNNETEWYDTKKEAQEKAKELAYDTDWTGDLLICEIKPLGLVEKAVKIKSL
jgi:hypothetical protein